VNLEVKTGSGAKFTTCPTQKAGYIIADIIKGMPQRGELVVISKDQKPEAANAAAKYMTDGQNEEEFWNNQRRAELPPLSPLQAPDNGGQAIPGPREPLRGEILTIPPAGVDVPETLETPETLEPALPQP
jgi:hypothetical protein